MEFKIDTVVKYRSKQTKIVTYETERMSRDFEVPGDHKPGWLKRFLLTITRNDIKKAGFALTGTQVISENFPTFECVVNFDNDTEIGSIVRKLVVV